MEDRRVQNWSHICQHFWTDALFDHDGIVTNTGLYKYGVRIREWMERHPDPESKEYQFAKLRLIMLERMFQDGSGCGFWTNE